MARIGIVVEDDGKKTYFMTDQFADVDLRIDSPPTMWLPDETYLYMVPQPPVSQVRMTITDVSKYYTYREERRGRQ